MWRQNAMSAAMMVTRKETAEPAVERVWEEASGHPASQPRLPFAFS